VWGKRRHPGGASFRLLTRTGGRLTAGSGAGQAEGSSGDRGGRRLPGGPEWPGGPNATWAGAERTKKTKKEMGRKDDWAEMVLGCAAKKKKIQILIQGIIFKFKF
jgi:hypothetical protein